jgi:myo-inositol-1(or 4)-monophosphatase
MVSEMDRAAEDTIRGVILGQRPADAILGEEGGEHGGASGIRWVVDPLDGTTNYLYGFPAWCVSVAAEDEHEVLAGAVYDPTHDELWTATLGGGARCNDEPLPPLAEDGDLGTALVGTGFAYQSARRSAQGAVAAHVLPRVRDIRRAGSAALDLCWVGAGRLDAYFEQGTHHWDRAAGALVAREAGAWVGGLDGGPPGDDGVVAARPGIVADLLALLAAADQSLRAGART